MAEHLSFLKMQATGNDFVVIDARDGEECDWPELAREMCDRHFGVGGDGLLVIGSSDRADARMRMFNADGTEDMCGNGLRCVARYLTGDARERRLRIATLAGVVPALVAHRQVTIELPPAQFASRDLSSTASTERVWDLPVTLAGREFRVYAASTATTHAAIFVDVVTEADFAHFSPLLEHHPLFPERASISWVTLIAPNQLRVRVWERGVGETLACGTGACAVAAIAHARGLTGRSVNVTMRGGALNVVVKDDGLALTGPAEFVLRGVYTRTRL